jgi:hypothetical protein
MFGGSFVVWEWSRSQILSDPLATLGRINRFQTLRQRTCCVGLSQSHNFAPPQQSLDGSSQAGPEFDLAGDGPLRYLCGETCIQNEGIRKLDWLAHKSKVAKRYFAARETKQ